MQLKPLALRFKRLISEVSLPTILTLTALHATVSFWGLKALGEVGITASASDFIYWYLVSCSTVGYGDLSPTTGEGKIFTVFFILTIGLSLFAMVLGKLANLFIEGRNKLMSGKRDFSWLENHIIIVGYEPRKTNRIVDLILADEHRTKRFILIASDDGYTHPYPDAADIGYVNLEDYTSVVSMNKMAVAKADKIIVCGENDAESFKLSVHFATIIKESGYITTHISDEDIATTLRGLNSPIEVTTPHRSEQLVKAMQDNGTSMLFSQLLTNGFEQTTYIIESTNLIRDISCAPGAISFGKLKKLLSEELGIMLIGVSSDRLGNNLKVNPANEFEVTSGKYLFYIGAKRLCQSDINKLASSKPSKVA